jgi:hypothetical protein
MEIELQCLKRTLAWVCPEHFFRGDPEGFVKYLDTKAAAWFREFRQLMGQHPVSNERDKRLADLDRWISVSEERDVTMRDWVRASKRIEPPGYAEGMYRSILNDAKKAVSKEPTTADVVSFMKK